MSQPWHKSNPSLLEKERTEVEAAYPHLHFFVEGEFVVIRGTLPITDEGQVLDRYLIDVQISRDHPKSIPIVRETGGRIAHFRDLHINPEDGTCCVILPDERWRVWPIGSSLRAFLDGPVRNFFLGQSLVAAGGPWPFGQWGHGAEGIREYYSELLGMSDARAIERFLECMSKKKIKGHWLCPCGGGRHLRECHLDLVEKVMRKVPRSVLVNSATRVGAKR